VGYALWAWSAGRSGQLDIAGEKMIKSQEVAQQLGGKVIMGDVSMAARAEIALLKGECNDAIELARQTLEVAKITGAAWSAGVAYRVWGLAMVNLNPAHWEAAEKHFAESIKVFEIGKNRLEAARTHLAWGKVCRDRGNTELANNYWELANRQFTESNSTGEMQAVQKLMASR
jgi:hypothetical protein